MSGRRTVLRIADRLVTEEDRGALGPATRTFDAESSTMYATSSVAINFLGQGCAGAKPLLAEDGLRGDPRLVLADWSRRLSVYGGPGWNLRR